MDISLIIVAISVKKIMPEHFIIQQHLNFMIMKSYYVIQMLQGITDLIENAYMEKMMYLFYSNTQSNFGENTINNR